MASNLLNRDCNSDYSDSEKMDSETIATHLAQISGWKLVSSNNESRIVRTFSCQNFKKAIELASKIGAEADRQDHHPSILVEWGKCTVTWWTHALGGLHLNDFIMAKKSEKLALLDT